MSDHSHPLNEPIRSATRRLALAFIVKDEGKYALEMLESIVRLVDFVGFIDTGSVDNSVELIASYLQDIGIPYKTGSQQLISFADARNAAIDLVPSGFEWILMLDSDEVILEKDHPALLQMLSDPHYDAWYIPRYNWKDKIWGEYLKSYPDYQGRLFRNGPCHRIRYEGAIHECLMGFKRIGHVQMGDVDVQGFSASLHIHHIKLFRKTFQELHNREVLYQKFYRQRSGVS
jgi:glycosyltransferase involved in cell wall biosynthesis